MFDNTFLFLLNELIFKESHHFSVAFLKLKFSIYWDIHVLICMYRSSDKLMDHLLLKCLARRCGGWLSYRYRSLCIRWCGVIRYLENKDTLSLEHCLYVWMEICGWREIGKLLTEMTLMHTCINGIVWWLNSYCSLCIGWCGGIRYLENRDAWFLEHCLYAWLELSGWREVGKLLTEMTPMHSWDLIWLS